jgi:antitoxin component YwqK of YwqJK toxin-antitoxin module
MFSKQYAKKSILSIPSFKAVIISAASLITFTLQAQDSGDLYCTKPQYRPKGDRHLNCKDASMRRQGLWKFYSYSGLLLNDLNYKDNKMHGSCTWYHATTGRIRVSANYFDGKRDGEFETFFFNGQTQASGEYNYGKRSGTWTYYYSTTGETRATGLYINGRQSGQWKYYQSNGKLLRTVEYVNGQAIKTTYPDPPPGKVPALASPGK